MPECLEWSLKLVTGEASTFPRALEAYTLRLLGIALSSIITLVMEFDGSSVSDAQRIRVASREPRFTTDGGARGASEGRLGPRSSSSRPPVFTPRSGQGPNRGTSALAGP